MSDENTHLKENGWTRPFPDNKVHGVNMGSIWDRQDPGGPHVGPMKFAIWVTMPYKYPTPIQLCK